MLRHILHPTEHRVHRSSLESKSINPPFDPDNNNQSSSETLNGSLPPLHTPQSHSIEHFHYRQHLQFLF
ncbi:hypothetical protein G7K_6573-t1 [Saitoella complicata NRRL Y-17804]|uniref:Uncharacterized protein n=1 Tax=Saitoella complicata (strain BCRC 22490 / CBS 7301 / JCM 7358 / NBRC 10748 / NRRL Y-17804) TaxID=698492 RepID=A0A0E9NRW2_SAICN|nr:hypothetical protein G7K_6573-t1 [Saitoella complicata NRRL Y-17804]